MGENKRIDTATGTQTVGHEWDGIEELDTPMPRWWLWTFYATIIWSLVYVVLYPAWPLVNSATNGILGWSSRGDLQKEMAAAEKVRGPITAAIAATPIEALPGKPELMQAAIQGGAAAFKVHCVQCHGSGAAGSKGYPNLNDDDWLWGGDLKSIEYTLTHGIRNPDHPQTRTSQMPAFGDILPAQDISALVGHVRAISSIDPKGDSARGRQLFAENCAVCHGPQGKGGREFGAPNLADGIWLYGSDADSIRATIANSRYGVMPRWNDKLDTATIKMLAVYVHALGGGEEAPVATADAANAAGAAEIPANVGQ